MTVKDVKIQIAILVKKINKCDRYGIDKKFAEKIEVGDMILITSTMFDIVYPTSNKDPWEIIITNKGISKKVSTARRVMEIFKRIDEFEQIGLV